MITVNWSWWWDTVVPVPVQSQTSVSHHVIVTGDSCCPGHTGHCHCTVSMFTKPMWPRGPVRGPEWFQRHLQLSSGIHWRSFHKMWSILLVLVLIRRMQILSVFSSESNQRRWRRKWWFWGLWIRFKVIFILCWLLVEMIISMVFEGLMNGSATNYLIVTLTNNVKEPLVDALIRAPIM